jgi:hypothetical protein
MKRGPEDCQLGTFASPSFTVVQFAAKDRQKLHSTRVEEPTLLCNHVLFGPIQLVRFVLRAQLVDATPSGIKRFSKVVFMRQGKRFGGTIRFTAESAKRFFKRLT